MEQQKIQISKYMNKETWSRVVNFQIQKFKYNIQIFGQVKSGKSLKCNQLVGFVPIKEGPRKNKSYYGLFPINSDPMTVQKVIYSYNPNKDYLFSFKAKCLGLNFKQMDKKLQYTSLKETVQILKQIRQTKQNMIQEYKKEKNQNKRLQIYKALEFKQQKPIEIQSPLKILQDQILSQHYNLVDNEGSTDIIKFLDQQQKKQQQGQKKQGLKQQGQKQKKNRLDQIIKCLKNETQYTDYIIYCVNLNKGCIDTIEQEFIQSLFKNYGERLSLSFSLHQYVKIDDDNLIQNENKLYNLIFNVIPHRINQIVQKIKQNEKQQIIQKPQKVKIQQSQQINSYWNSFIKQSYIKIQNYFEVHNAYYPINQKKERNYEQSQHLKQLIKYYPFNIINFHGLPLGKKIDKQEFIHQILSQSNKGLKNKLRNHLKKNFLIEVQKFNAYYLSCKSQFELKFGFQYSSQEKKKQIIHYLDNVIKEGNKKIAQILKYCQQFFKQAKKGYAQMNNELESVYSSLFSRIKAYIYSNDTNKKNITLKINQILKTNQLKISKLTEVFIEKIKKLLFQQINQNIEINQENSLKESIKKFSKGIIFQMIYNFSKQYQNQYNALMKKINYSAVMKHIQIEIPQLQFSKRFLLLAGDLIRLGIIMIPSGLVLFAQATFAITLTVIFGVPAAIICGGLSFILISIKLYRNNRKQRLQAFQEQQQSKNFLQVIKVFSQQIRQMINKFAENQQNADFKTIFDRQLRGKLLGQYNIKELQKLQIDMNQTKKKKDNQINQYLSKIQKQISS